MPTVNGYTGFPQTQPAATPGSDFQNIQSSPEAFGAQVGAALQSVSGQGEKLGDVFAKHALELQSLKNQDEANQTLLKASTEVGELAAQFEALKGADAAAAYPKYQQDLVALRDKYKSGMANANSARLFDQNFTNRLERILYYGASHAASQQREAFTGNAKAAQQLSMGDISQHPDDDKVFADSLSSVQQKAREVARIQGYGPDTDFTKQAVAKATSEAYEQRIFEISKTNPSTAMRIWQQHQGEVTDPTIRNRIEGHIAQGFLTTDTANAAQQILGGGPNLSVGQIKQLALKVGFPEDKANIAAATFMAESGGNPNARNEREPTATNKGEHSYGIPQINADAHGPAAKAALGNPEAQMKMAFDISKGGTDFSPWTMYTNGEYKKYLAEAQGSSPQAPTTLDQRQMGMLNRFNKALQDSDGDANAAAAKSGVPVGLFDGKLVPYDEKSGAPLVATQPAQQKKTLEQALKDADDRTNQLVANGTLGPNSPVPEAIYREKLKNQIRSQYNVSQSAERDARTNNLNAVRNAILQKDAEGNYIYKDLGSFLANDNNRSAYYALEPPQQAVIDRQIASNATHIPPTPERLERYNNLKNMAIAAPDEFLKIDPLHEDLPNSIKQSLLNEQRSIQKRVDSPQTWQTDLSRAKAQIKEEGLVPFLDLNSKTDDRAHRFVAALATQLQEFEQEKKRSMNPDEVRKAVAGLVRQTNQGVFNFSQGLGKHYQFEQFVPKSFRDAVTARATQRGQPAPSPERLIQMYHDSDEYKRQAPTPESEASDTGPY